MGKLKGLEIGSVIKFKYKDTQMQGVLISHTHGNYNIKLLNGYNLSLPEESLELIEITSHIDSMKREEPAGEAPPSGDRKIALIGTGGTIASRVDYITGAVKPVLNAGFLRESVSNISKYTLDTNLLEAVLSENLVPADWVRIARNARDLLARNQGAVVLHGTDTMSYTASALSFMFEKLSGPIVFVGSQRSPDRPSSDAFLNLEAGLEFASSNFAEVTLALHEGMSDSAVLLHRAVRSRKMHSSRRDAFKSIGIEPLGSYICGKVEISDYASPRDSETTLLDKLDERVALVYFQPAMTESDFTSMTEKKRAVVIMGTGLGHTGTRLYPAIKEIIGRGDHVLMTTQCLYGSVNMNVYSTGRELLSLGVVPLAGMLPEAALIKSMHVLANYPDENFDRQMATDMRGEIPDRETFQEDL